MTTAVSRWLRRLLTAGAVGALVVAATRVFDLDPEPVRVVLLCLLLVALAGLLSDGLPRTSVLWYAVPIRPPVAEGRDQVTQAHLRLLENHQLSRRPDAAVRDRLAHLADQVLLARHGVPLRSEQGRALLGSEVLAVLEGPVVRLPPRRIERVLRHLEEL